MSGLLELVGDLVSRYERENYAIEAAQPKAAYDQLKGTKMPAVLIPPQLPLGMIRSFSVVGEQYEIVRPLRQLEDGDWMFEIKLVKTGESVEYRMTRINDDPVAY